jgi:hypothetical protein
VRRYGVGLGSRYMIAVTYRFCFAQHSSCFPG